MKSEIDSVEAGVKSFERASSDGSNLEQGADLEARVGALEHGIRNILEAPTVRTSFNLPKSTMLR